MMHESVVTQTDPKRDCVLAGRTVSLMDDKTPDTPWKKYTKINTQKEDCKFSLSLDSGAELIVLNTIRHTLRLVLYRYSGVDNGRLLDRISKGKKIITFQLCHSHFV